MSTIEIIEDTFSCNQEEDMAVFKILKGAKILTATVSGREVFFKALNEIKTAHDIRGVAFLYSPEYHSEVEYGEYMKEIMEGIKRIDGSRHYMTFKHSIFAYLESIYTFPKPIVGGMDGNLSPLSFATNLAFDFRIATGKTNFILPDLKFGLPPSPLLSFYLTHSLGSLKASELILTKSEITAQEAFDLGLLTQVVSKENLKNSCINKLRELTPIPSDALIECRRTLKPSLKKMQEHIDEGFEGIVRCMHSMRKLS